MIRRSTASRSLMPCYPQRREPSVSPHAAPGRVRSQLRRCRSIAVASASGWSRRRRARMRDTPAACRSSASRSLRAASAWGVVFTWPFYLARSAGDGAVARAPRHRVAGARETPVAWNRTDTVLSVDRVPSRPPWPRVARTPGGAPYLVPMPAPPRRLLCAPADPGHFAFVSALPRLWGPDTKVRESRDGPKKGHLVIAEVGLEPTTSRSPSRSAGGRTRRGWRSYGETSRGGPRRGSPACAGSTPGSGYESTGRPGPRVSPRSSLRSQGRG